MKKTFTDQFIASVKTSPGQKRAQFTDAACLGLMLRVTDNGVRTFSWVYRRPKALGGNMGRFPIGRYPAITLKAARRKANEARALLESGTDPVAELEAAKPRVEDVTNLTFEGVASAFVTFKSDPKSPGYIDSHKHLASFLKRPRKAWGALPFASITAKMIAQLAEQIARDGGPAAAMTTQTAIHRLYKWSLHPARQYATMNPAAGIPHVAKRKRRTRLLKDTEIVTFWKNLDSPAKLGISPQLAMLYRLVLATMCRPGMAAGMEKSELHDLDGPEPEWHLPAHRMKKRRSFILPLSPLAVSIIKQGMINNDTPYVFKSVHSKKGTPLTVWAMSLALRGNSQRKGIIKTLKMESFKPHDLRRTAASFARKSGAKRDCVKALLSHMEDDTTAIYDLYDMLSEKREAAMILGTALGKLLWPNKMQEQEITPPLASRRAA